MIVRIKPMAERMIPAMAMPLPLEFIPRAPSRMPTTLMSPPHQKLTELHRDRMPITREAMAKPLELFDREGETDG